MKKKGLYFRPKITRREFLKNASVALAGTVASFPVFNLSCRSKPSSFNRPNILFITTDYQRGLDIPWGPARNFLQMPYLQRLVDEGVNFTRYFSTAPICMPARYTLITGQYPHTHGQQDNQARWVPDESPILMVLLREAGYYTIGVGKMHFYPWPRLAGYHRRIIADRKGNWIGDNERQDDYALFLAKHGLTRWDYLKLQSEGDIFGVYDWPYDESLHIDAYVGHQAAKVIENGELPSPWFMWVSFNGPHNPWDPPSRCSQFYLSQELSLGHTFPGELRTKPKDHTRLRYNYTPQVVDRIDRNRANRDRILHRILAGHYGNLSFIDEQVGKILSALEKKGELDRTIIIFSSDHGSHLGDHDLIHKGTHYDTSTRVPFVVWNPRLIRRPRVVSGFAGHVDFLPTILSLVERPIPPEVEGKDLSPLILKKASSVQDRVIIEIRWGTAIITNRWKMSIYPRDGDGDLYDLAKDPYELHNLFYSPEHEKIKNTLLNEMKAVNLHLEEELVKGPTQRMPPPRQIYWKSGAGFNPKPAPNFQGKKIRIKTTINKIGRSPLNGILVHQVRSQETNGYVFYVEDDRPIMSVLIWGKVYVVVSSVRLLPGKTVLEGILEEDGTIIIRLNHRVVGQGKAPGVLPVQPGHSDVVPCGQLYIGQLPDDYQERKHFVSGSLKKNLKEVFLSFEELAG